MSLSPSPRKRPVRASADRNRAGLAALGAGLLGCAAGLAPPVFWLAGLLGLLGLGLGVVARARARRRVAGNGPAAGVGILLSALAMVLSVVGVAIVATASDGTPAPRATPGSTAPQKSARPTATGAPPAAGRSTPAPVTEPDPRPAAPIRIDGRSAYTYDDGLRIQVVEVRRVTFSPWSTAGPRRGAAVTVRITNGTPEPADLEFARVVLRHGPEATQAESIFDSVTGFGGGFDGGLAPGRSATARFGFGVPRGATAVSVEVSPGWYYDPTSFEGRLAG